MKAGVIFVLLLMLCYAQVTAAPFFMVSAAQADLLLVSLAILLVFQGPKVAMVSLPVIAVLLGFVSDRSPAVLIIALLPLLPLAYWLEEAAPTVARYAQTLFAVGVTGLWARTVLSITVFAQGAPVDVGALIFQVLVPGLILDLTLLSLAYLGCRLLGWEPRSLSPARQRYRA
jgi:hypothetical protein